jgi:hypothetical protein
MSGDVDVQHVGNDGQSRSTAEDRYRYALRMFSEQQSIPRKIHLDYYK